MEWECHLDGIKRIREEIELPTARVVDGSAELSRRVGIGGYSYANFDPVWCSNFMGCDLGEMPLCRSPRRKRIIPYAWAS